MFNSFAVFFMCSATGGSAILKMCLNSRRNIFIVVGPIPLNASSLFSSSLYDFERLKILRIFPLYSDFSFCIISRSFVAVLKS